MWRCEDVDLQMWGCEDVDLQVWGCEDVDQQMWGCEDVDQQVWGCEDVDLQMWGCEDVDQQMWGCEDVDLQAWRCEDVDQQMWGCEDVDLQMWGCEDVDLQVWGCEDVDQQMWGCEDVDQQVWGCEDVDLQMWGCEDVDQQMWGCEDVDLQAWRCEDVDQQMWGCEDVDQQMWRCEDVLQRLLFYEEPFAGALGKNKVEYTCYILYSMSNVCIIYYTSPAQADKAGTGFASFKAGSRLPGALPEGMRYWRPAWDSKWLKTLVSKSPVRGLSRLRTYLANNMWVSEKRGINPSKKLEVLVCCSLAQECQRQCPERPRTTLCLREKKELFGETLEEANSCFVPVKHKNFHISGDPSKGFAPKKYSWNIKISKLLQFHRPGNVWCHHRHGLLQILQVLLPCCLMP